MVSLPHPTPQLYSFLVFFLQLLRETTSYIRGATPERRLGESSISTRLPTLNTLRPPGVPEAR